LKRFLENLKKFKKIIEEIIRKQKKSISERLHGGKLKIIVQRKSR
jgi:hypothetical protein